MNRTIRPLAETDIEAVQDLDRVAHGSPWSTRTYLADISGNDRVHLVAEANDELVGHAAVWIDQTACRITNVAVAADHGGQGHASALLVAVLHESLRSNRVANVQLEVRPSNRRAQRLYSRFGFVPVGIERNFYDRGDALGNKDAVIMAVTDACDGSWRERLETIAREQEERGAAA